MSDNDSAYVFKDVTGRTQHVSGSPQAIAALSILFVRLDALERGYASIQEIANILAPRKVDPT